MLTPLLAALLAATPAEQRGFDITALDYVVVLDPATGVTHGTLAISVTVVTSDAHELEVTFDAGLSLESAKIQGSDAGLTVVPAATTPLRSVGLMFDDALAAGDTRVIEVTLDGTLACNVSDIQGHRACKRGAAFGYLRRQSVLPTVHDAADTTSYELYRRSLSLTLPAEVDAVATGDAVATTTTDGQTTRVWASTIVHDVQDLVVVFGALTSLSIDDGELPVTLWYPRGDEAWVDDMRAWIAIAMPFHAALAGRSLPLDGVDIVKLPDDPGFAGTATAGMVLLSEGYGNLGAGNFEQTLAHELSHLWWGNLAYADERGAWLLEGLARYSELEYITARYPAGEAGFEADDGSLRSRWHADLMRYTLRSKAPLVLTGIAQPPSDIVDYEAWAYARGAATLDHLRVVIGRAAFAAGLARWADDCAFVRCTSDDFRTFMEEASGKDLAAFFAQYVYATTFTDLAYAFTQARTASGVDVTVSFTQVPAADSTLELWLEHEDGSVDKQLVDMTGASGSVTLASAAPVVRVRPNPYDDPIVWSRSQVDGDVDFDGAVDGVDVVTCAQYVALGFPAVQSSTTLLDVVPIDFRCDLDHDGVVDGADLALIAADFGTLEAVLP